MNGGGYSNLYSSMKRVVMIAPRILDDDTAVTGTVDLQGMIALELEIISGDVQTGSSAALTFTLQHADQSNFSDAVDVPDSLLIGLESGLDISSNSLVRRIGYKVAAGKRYVRVTTAPGGHLVSQIRPVAVVGINPQSWAPVSGFINGAVIDTHGYGYVSLAYQFGANTMTGKALGSGYIQHGNQADGSDMANVSPYSLIDVGQDYVADWQFAAGSANEITRAGYLPTGAGAKRYVRVRLETIGATGGAILVSSYAELMNLPTATAFGVLALMRDRYSHSNTEQ